MKKIKTRTINGTLYPANIPSDNYHDVLCFDEETLVVEDPIFAALVERAKAHLKKWFGKQSLTASNGTESLHVFITGTIVGHDRVFKDKVHLGDVSVCFDYRRKPEAEKDITAS